MKKFILREMRGNDNNRVKLTDIQPKFREIFAVPISCKGKAFSKRLGRFRKKAKFGHTYDEIIQRRKDNPGMKINDLQNIEWTWEPYENMQN